MNANALRTWGIGVSAAVMVGALVLAVQPEPNAAPLAASSEFAQTANTAAPIAFVVRFRGAGPIARAQAAAARGQTTSAQRQVETQLRRQTDFSGLCFDRFTVGGAEIVLRTCAAIVPSERGAMQQRWLERLRAMRAVEYADVNATATQNRAG
jgi:hypothetical protein